MKVVVQRCRQASVAIDGKCHASIGEGFVLLVGIAQTDTEKELAYVAQKVAQLRVFADEQQKMNRSILDVGGQILSISQFTLLANTKKGNRPSFVHAAKPDIASTYYDLFNTYLREHGLTVATGQFGADMQVSLTNDGPVTIIIDTEAL